MRQLGVAVTTATPHKDDGASTTTTGRDTYDQPPLVCSVPYQAVLRRNVPQRAATRRAVSRRALSALQHARLMALVQLGHARQVTLQSRQNAMSVYVCRDTATVCCNNGLSCPGPPSKPAHLQLLVLSTCVRNTQTRTHTDHGTCDIGSSGPHLCDAREAD